MESQQDRTARIVQAHREYYQSGQTRIWQFRRTQLRLLLKAIGRYEAELCEALWRDLHKSWEEAFLTEIALVKAETKGLIRHLKHWSATRRAATPLFMFGSCSRIRQEPYGVVAILSPWNYPFQFACRRIGCRKLRGTETLAPYACGKRSDAQADFGSFCPGIRVVFGRRCRDGPCVTAATVGLYLFYR